MGLSSVVVNDLSEIYYKTIKVSQVMKILIINGVSSNNMKFNGKSQCHKLGT